MAYSGSRFQTPLYVGDGSGQVEKDSARVLHLMELHIKDASQTLLDSNLFLTDNHYDITYDSATNPESSAPTFTAAGKLLGFGAVSETTQIKINTLAVTLSGVTTGDISDIVHSNIINKRVVIYRSFLDDNHAFQTNRTFMMFDGNIKNFSAMENGEESTITINVASHWANFQATNGRKTNKASQSVTKQYNSTNTFFDDTGFDFSSTQVRDIRWGAR